MSKKVFNVFSILCFALVLCFIGCTELINPKTETDINLNIDLSKIIKSSRNEGGSQGASSLGENPTIKVAIYDAKDYDKATNSTENLTLITQAQASVGGDGIARVKLSDIPVGIYAIVFAELSFSNGNSTEVMYAGNSEVFKVKASDNKIRLVLKKVSLDIEPDDETNAETPTIITQPESSIKTVTDNNSNKQTLSCTACVSDGGTLSFVWYVKYNDIDEYCCSANHTEITNNDDGSITSKLIDLEAHKGQIFYVYCEITNTNNSVNGEKTATIESNIITFACLQGELTSIRASYEENGYQLFSEVFNYDNVKVIETYTSSDNSTETITVPADSSRYTITKTNNSISAIGYVPYTVTYMNNTNLTSPLCVPVKYKLPQEGLKITGTANTSEWGTSESPELVAQYTGIATLSVGYAGDGGSVVPSLIYKTEDSESADYDVMTSDVDVEWINGTVTDQPAYVTVDNSTEGDFIYTATITPKEGQSWCIEGSVSASYYVKVCPWEIILTPSESTSTVDPNNISLDTTYTLSISNDAYTSTSQNPPSAIFSYLEDNIIIFNDQLKITDDNFTKGTIIASITINDQEVKVASLVISRVNTSVTYAEGLTYIGSSTDDPGTLYISSAEGLITFRNIVNGSLDSDIIVQHKNNSNSTNTFSADKEYQNVNAVLESDITLSGDWTPIGVYSTNTTTTAKPYSGTFDGNGKTITFENITHLYTEMYSSGLFQMLAGTVKNLIIDGSISRYEVGYIGGITGYLNGGTIENCVNKALITNSASIGTGGIVGYVGTAGGNITGCINIEKVLSSSSVGGIVGNVGNMSENSNLTISKCINLGEISGASNISGILGTASASQITISDCMNLGKISADNTSEPAYASGITTPSEVYTVSSCINVGQVTATGTPSFQGGISSVTDKGIYSDNYYDSSINSEVLDSDIYGITGKLTSELIGSNLSLDGISTADWTFADNRYPLPNIAGNIPDGEDGLIWQKVIVAATPDSSSVLGGGIDGKYVSSAEELKSALEDTSVNTILINADISIDSTINITRDVIIAANNDVTLTQNVTDYEMINVAADVNFVLGGGSGTLTIKGNSSLTQNIIYSKGNVTLKDKLVINNSYATSGAIYVYAGSLKMEGGEISNNQSNAITSNMGGGDVTIDIYGGKIYNNTKDSQYYGSAIYINNSSYYDATVNIYGEAQIYNNNNSSGAAIRLYDADSVLYINSSDSENKAAIYDNTTTNIQIDAGQLFINNTKIDISNYTENIIN